jgi:hypothetical protein
MLQTRIVLQDSNSGRSSVLINEISTLGASAPYSRIRAAIAYASYSGCRSICTRLAGTVGNWEAMQKRWLVSIDFGRTEIRALEYLRDLPNSEVRIPDAPELLQNGLIPGRCFHPKTYIFDTGANIAGAPCAIFVGSGNLTLSGLHAGVEHGTSLLWRAPLNATETRTLRDVRAQLMWWDEVWETAHQLTEDLLDEYGRALPPRPREDRSFAVRSFASAAAREVEIDLGLAWAHARCFWIQTLELYKNRGRNQPGNQIDLRRGTRVFFGFPPDAVSRNTVLGSINLRYEDGAPCSRSVRFGNNFMDKVNLPIPGVDGPEDYDNSVIHFERIGPREFRITLGTPETAQIWRDRSQEQGLPYELAGGREFGFYS